MFGGKGRGEGGVVPRLSSWLVETLRAGFVAVTRSGIGRGSVDRTCTRLAGTSGRRSIVGRSRIPSIERVGGERVDAAQHGLVVVSFGSVLPRALELSRESLWGTSGARTDPSRSWHPAWYAACASVQREVDGSLCFHLRFSGACRCECRSGSVFDFRWDLVLMHAHVPRGALAEK